MNENTESQESKATTHEAGASAVERLVIISFHDLGMRENGKLKSKFVLSDGRILFNEVKNGTPPTVRLRKDKSAMVAAGVSRNDFDESCSRLFFW